jgi:uncharacterized protein YjiS (DUF1127 family)
MTHILKLLNNIKQAIYDLVFMPATLTQYHNTFKQLDKLSDRDLWDMGITRGDIHDIASGKFKK